MTVTVADPDSLSRQVEAAIAAGYDRILIGGGAGTPDLSRERQAETIISRSSHTHDFLTKRA